MLGQLFLLTSKLPSKTSSNFDKSDEQPLMKTLENHIDFQYILLNFPRNVKDTIENFVKSKLLY